MPNSQWTLSRPRWYEDAKARRCCRADRTFAPRGRTRETPLMHSLPVLNLAEARFDCIFGRGCDGICCRNGRPAVYEDEAERIAENMHKFLPELRDKARAAIKAAGHLTRRRKFGLPMFRVVDGWCVFFN